MKSSDPSASRKQDVGEQDAVTRGVHKAGRAGMAARPVSMARAGMAARAVASPGAPGPRAVLTDRALNRALLARQGLAEPWTCPPLEAVERLVGMQSQSPEAPYFGLWSRLANFDAAQLSGAMLDRSAVRIALMRSTLHLISARDCVELRPILQADLERALRSAIGRRIVGLDLTAVANCARALVLQRPLTFAKLGKLLAPHFPSCHPGDLTIVARTMLPLVQVTPRGMWGRAMIATHTTADEWLGRPLGRPQPPDDLIRRYLRAFGPASVGDFRAWSGLAGVRPHFERLRPELVTYSNESGLELFDVPDGLLPDEDTRADVRIIAEFDNLLLAHVDRRRIFDDAHRRTFMTSNGIVSSTFLVDGFVAGTCRLSAGVGTKTVTLSPFVKLRRSDEDALRTQADRLLRFAAPNAERTEVYVNGPL